MRLFNYLKTLVDVLPKDEILDGLKADQKLLTTVVIPALEQIKASSNFKSKEIKSFEKDFKSSFIKNSKDPISFMDERLPKLLQLAIALDHELDRFLPKSMLALGLSTRNALVVRTADHVAFLTKYSLDTLAYMTYLEDKSVSKRDDGTYTKGQIEDYLDYTAIYTNLLEQYTVLDANALLKKFKDVPDVVLNDENYQAVTASYGETKLDPITALTIGSGFVGNIFYHMGLTFAEWSVNRYDTMAEKKKVIELRLLHLKMLEDGNEDPKLTKEIEYLSKRVNRLEYDMVQIERSAGL